LVILGYLSSLAIVGNFIIGFFIIILGYLPLVIVVILSQKYLVVLRYLPLAIIGYYTINHCWLF
jgi:hypothetical protein